MICGIRTTELSANIYCLINNSATNDCITSGAVSFNFLRLSFKILEQENYNIMPVYFKGVRIKFKGTRQSNGLKVHVKAII